MTAGKRDKAPVVMTFERARAMVGQLENAATSYHDLENMRTYAEAKRVFEAGGPRAGHQFHFSVTCQGASSVVGDPDSYRDDDWIAEPYTVTVRASSLSQACKRVSLLALNEWTAPGEEEETTR